MGQEIFQTGGKQKKTCHVPKDTNLSQHLISDFENALLNSFTFKSLGPLDAAFLFVFLPC
jgi:hypothetical protein